MLVKKMRISLIVGTNLLLLVLISAAEIPFDHLWRCVTNIHERGTPFRSVARYGKAALTAASLRLDSKFLGIASGPNESGAGLSNGSPSVPFEPLRPAPPQQTPDTSMPTQTGTVRNVAAGDSSGLQNAIDSSKCGDTIVLQAGSTYIGNFVVPRLSCSNGWVLVQSSAASLLPVDVRVHPSDDPKMAKIETVKRNVAAVRTESGAHNFRFIGLDITCSGFACDIAADSGADFVNALVSIDCPEFACTSAVQEPQNIVVDRCYIHGSPTSNVRRAISVNGSNLAVINSYISDIHEVGADSQAIAGWNGTGPFLIHNNFLSAAGENVIFGGSGVSIKGLIASDVTVTRNHFYKDPSWFNSRAPYNWSAKNLFECKNEQRVLLDSNILEYSFAGGQHGDALLLSPRGEGFESWATCSDISITRNLVQHVAEGIEITGSDDGGPSQPSQRVLVQNNLFYDVNDSVWAGGNAQHGGVFIYTPKGRTPPRDIVFDHNDIFANHNALYYGDCPAVVSGFQWTNMIALFGAYGVLGNGGNSCSNGLGLPNLTQYFSAPLWGAAVFLDGSGGSWPPRTYFSDFKSAGFANYSRIAANYPVNNFRLLPKSRYHNAGMDGKDIGVDIDALNSALAGVQ
jgi:hypothetical protein